MASRSKRSELSAGTTSVVPSATPDGGSRKGTRARTIDPNEASAEEIGGAEHTPAAGPGVDALLADLERIVHELESGDLPLEAALARFETGIRLARRGGALLDALEQRVDVLLGGRIEPADLDLDDSEGFDDESNDPDDPDESDDADD